MAAAGHRPAKLTASRNITSVPSMTRPRHRPAASVRRHRRNIRLSVKGEVLAAHFNQTGPAGKHPYSPAHSGLPAMSRLPAGRAKRTKNPPPAGILPAAPPTPPPDLPASVGRKTAALQAAYPAEAVALPEVGAGDFPRIPRGVEASPAWVLPAVEVSPRIHLKAAALVVRAQRQMFPVAGVPLAASPAAQPRAAVLAAASAKPAVVLAALVRRKTNPVVAARLGAGPVGQPGAAALAVNPPKRLKSQKSPNPAQQEQGHPHPLASPGSGQPAHDPVRQE